MTTYGVLGPLSVAGDAVTAGRDRVVLAMLLLHTDRVLGSGELIAALWGEQPPSTARGQLQTCVSRLRRVLPPGAIGTEPAGYRLSIGPDDLDAAVFGRMVAEARERRDPELFRRALDLWRGPALAEIESEPVRRAAAVLDERRVAAEEEWVDLELADGPGPDLLAELAGLVERFPLRERLRGQLMVALHRSGRQADAFAEYRRAREVLLEELGVEPGRRLQELHRQLLAGDVSQAESSAPAPAPVRCLPRTVGDFTGREAVLDRLIGAIGAAGPGGPALAVIDGMAGSGKTTLALRLASLVGDRYPGAHLFVDLYGHSDRAPLEPAAALLTLLRQLGVAAHAIPVERLDRLALWRDELSRRRVLVVFDNAGSSAQLADLLPTSPGALAVVTSRRRLVGLDDVHHEPLPVLAPEEAATLLARIAGDRVRAEPEAAAEVVRLCGGLPLALRLAGARLARRPRWRVADLVRRLGASALPELSVEDRSVADAFALSYGQLAGPAGRMFRLLGLYPGTDFDALGAAALAGLPLDDAQDALDDLLDVHLLEEPERNVFRLHDLLREFAAALAADVSPGERADALTGVLDFQMHAAAAVMPAVYHELAAQDLGAPRPLRGDLLAEVADPVARFERERRHLPAFVEAAAGSGRPEYAWWIPRVAWWYMFFRGYNGDLTTLLERAMSISRESGDRGGVAVVANYLASGYLRSCDLDRALGCLQLSIRIREELGQRGALARALGNLAGIYESSGRFADAAETAREALRVAALAGDRSLPTSPRSNLSRAYLRLGRYPEALWHGRLQLLTAIGNRDDGLIYATLLQIQRIKWRQGTGTIETARRNLDLLLRLGIRGRLQPVEGDARHELAKLLRAEGRFAEAAVEHRAAVAIARRTDDLRHEADYLNEFAYTRRAAGDLPAARELYERALRIARSGRIAYESARAEAGLGDCLAGTDPEQARRYWTAALAAFREMGVPEQAEVERRPVALGGDAGRMGGEDQLRPAADGGTMVR